MDFAHHEATLNYPQSSDNTSLARLVPLVPLAQRSSVAACPKKILGGDIPQGNIRNWVSSLLSAIRSRLGKRNTLLATRTVLTLLVAQLAAFHLATLNSVVASPAGTNPVVVQQETASEATASPTTPPVEKSAPAPHLLLKNVRIMGPNYQVLAEANSVLIAGDRIAAVGVELVAPTDARVIDGQGATLCAGLIDSRSRLWIERGSLSQSAADASLDIRDALDPYADEWRDAVQGGVTAVYVQPANTNVCGGWGAVVAAAPVAEQVEVLRADAGLQVALGFGSDASGRGRLRQFEQLKKLLEDTRKYRDEWQAYRDYEAKQKAAAEKNPAPTTGEKPASEQPERTPATGDAPRADQGERPAGSPPSGGRGGRRFPRRDGSGEPPAGGSGTPPAVPPATPPTQSPEGAKPPTQQPETPAEKAPAEKAPPKPKLDPLKERLLPVLAGEIPVHCEIHHPDDLRRLLKLVQDFKLNVVIGGVVGVGQAWTELAESRHPLIIGPWFSESGPAVEMQKFWQRDLQTHAGRWALAGLNRNAADSRGLRHQAAQAVAAGVPAARVWSAITSDAAQILGVAEHVGRVAVGWRADLWLTAGDPLDVRNPIKLTVVGGRVVHELAAAESVAAVEQPLTTPSLPPQFPAEFRLRSERVWLGAQGWQPRVLTIRQGQIAEVSEQVDPASDLPLWDVGNAPITPGLMTAHATLGISPTSSAAAESTARHISAADGFAPLNMKVYEQQLAGLLTALVAPSQQNTLGGRLAEINFGSRQPIANRDAGDYIVLTNAARNRDKFPATLLGQTELLESFLGGQPVSSRYFLPKLAESTWMEQLQNGRRELMAGQRLAMFVADSDAEVQAALNLIEKHRLRAAIYGIARVDRFTDRLLATGTTWIVPPLKWDQPSVNWQRIAAASRAGVPLLFSGESAAQLRLTAAVAIENGCEERSALAGLLGDRRPWSGDGTPSGLAPSAPANLVIWQGLPTDLRSGLSAVVVDGKRLAPLREASATPHP